MFRSVLCLLLVPCAVGAQSDYFNLDAGRPTRVEDAIPTPRYQLDLQLVPFRYELLSNDARRWRADPKLTYGIAPLTEVELRAPVLVVDPRVANSPVTSGLGGLAVGALHAFGLETGPVPALALAGEYVAPVGSLSARTGSYSIKGIATKTFTFGRLHANVGGGTWSIRTSNTTSQQCPIRIPGSPPVPGCDNSQPAIPDSPCDRFPFAPASAHVTVSTQPSEPAQRAVLASGSTDPPPIVGRRWMAGVGMDRAFALTSTLLTGDVAAERFIDLYTLPDWSAELGVRHQWTPQLVMDLGFTRHFVGLPRSNAVTFGLAYGMPLQLRAIREARQ
ncbi:MAG TPA: hypothetical protein VGG84_06675 [Gemmatimonadaceae bacterium]